MTRTYVWFTYGGDGEKLIQSVRGAHHFDPAADKLVLDESAQPLCFAHCAKVKAFGAEVVRTTFPRNGNLRGRRCISAMWAWLTALRGEVVKIDSDVLLLGRVETDTSQPAIYSRGLSYTRNVFGGFYIVTPPALDTIDEGWCSGEFDALLDKGSRLQHEDLFVRKMVRNANIPTIALNETRQIEWWNYKMPSPLEMGLKVVVPDGSIKGDSPRWVMTMRSLLDEAGAAD